MKECLYSFGVALPIISIMNAFTFCNKEWMEFTHFYFQMLKLNSAHFSNSQKLHFAECSSLFLLIFGQGELFWWIAKVFRIQFENFNLKIPQFSILCCKQLWWDFIIVNNVQIRTNFQENCIIPHEKAKSPLENSKIHMKISNFQNCHSFKIENKQT